MRATSWFSIRAFLIVAILMTSASAFAQLDTCDPYCSPDYGDFGGGGGGACYNCSLYGGQANCVGMYNFTQQTYPGGAHQGYTSCQAYNVPTGYYGPNYCVVSGTCWWYTKGAATVRHESQIAAIETFLRQSGVISDADLNDFIAKTDYALRDKPYKVADYERVVAYIAEFNQLIARGDKHRELKLGEIPVTPHKPVKTSSTVTASK